MSTVDVASYSQSEHEVAGLTADDLHSMYYYMQLTRLLEDRVRALYLQGKIAGAVYSSRGQEGTCVAAALTLEPGDYLVPAIRDIGGAIVRGVEPKRIFAQWLGRVGGPTKGRDGNLHMGNMDLGIPPPISMLGSNIPIACGLVLASVQRGEDRVVLVFSGDGATNTGDFHEGLNFAAALKLPLVLIVEDNGFAYSTPVAQHVAIKNFAERAKGYGIPSVTIDGNDVIAVHQTTRQAIDRARAGGGPMLIEVKTFRIRGHAEHDDAFYVPKELMEYWEGRDPIDLLVTYTSNHGLMSTEQRAAIDERVLRELEAALKWAEDSPLPDGATQADGIYA